MKRSNSFTQYFVKLLPINGMAWRNLHSFILTTTVLLSRSLFLHLTDLFSVVYADLLLTAWPRNSLPDARLGRPTEAWVVWEVHPRIPRPLVFFLPLQEDVWRLSEQDYICRALVNNCLFKLALYGQWLFYVNIMNQVDNFLQKKLGSEGPIWYLKQIRRCRKNTTG